MIFRCIIFAGFWYFVISQCKGNGEKWEDELDRLEPSMATKFIDNKLVPGMIPMPPRRKCDVVFFRENEFVKVRGGEEVDVQFGFFRPYNVSWPTEGNSLYTMFYTTDDYPLDKNLSSFTEFHHWHVVNIQGNDWYNGDVVLDFLEPFQLPGLGYTHYIFLIYKQPERINVPSNKHLISDISVRTSYKCREFAKKYNLEPWAGNFFLMYYYSAEVTERDVFMKLDEKIRFWKAENTTTEEPETPIMWW